MDVILSLMKKRILLCVTRDQFEPFDYSSNATGAIISMGLNSGNGVFQFALQKMLLHPEVSLDIDTSFHNDADEFLGKADFINANYDAAITSVANGLAVWAKESGHLRRWAKCVGRIKIPFTFVGLGAQSDTAYGMDFADEIRDEAKEFLGAIIKTGGAIGLRGDFTAKVAKHLGFSGDMLQTVGCPSLFMTTAWTFEPLGMMTVSILSTVPDTLACTGAEKGAGLSPTTVPTYTVSPAFTVGAHGAPMCCCITNMTFSGTGRSTVAQSLVCFLCGTAAPGSLTSPSLLRNPFTFLAI